MFIKRKTLKQKGSIMMKTVPAFILFINDIAFDILCEWRKGLLAADTRESRITLYLLHPFHIGLMRISIFLNRYMAQK